MSSVIYATGNSAKFRQARQVCQLAGIEILQQHLDVPELQSEDGATIALDEAARAYAKFDAPVIISDDSWMIPGLKGFPGPYMKYVNDWFTVDDWLNLTRQLQDRRVVLRQIVVYQDYEAQKLFSIDLEGLILTEPRGKSDTSNSHIFSFDGGKRSNAEYHEHQESAVAHLPNVWHEFADWYQQVHA